MNILKSKLRNKMQQPMLEALLHIRSFMARSNVCNNEFVPTKTMLNEFNNDIYTSTSNEDDSIPEDFEIIKEEFIRIYLSMISFSRLDY